MIPIPIPAIKRQENQEKLLYSGFASLPPSLIFPYFEKARATSTIRNKQHKEPTYPLTAIHVCLKNAEKASESMPVNAITHNSSTIRAKAMTEQIFFLILLIIIVSKFITLHQYQQRFLGENQKAYHPIGTNYISSHYSMPLLPCQYLHPFSKNGFPQP